MARPKKKVTKQRVTITITPSLLCAAQEFAYETGESLSGLIERLLRGAIGPHNVSSIEIGGIANNQRGGKIGNISITNSPTPNNHGKT